MTRRTPLRFDRPVLEELEPRVLYSADLAPALLGVSGMAPHAEHRTLDANGEFLQPENSTETQSVRSSRELVFVDTRVADYQRIVDDIQAQAGSARQFEVALLDANADGIEQISSALRNESGLSAVHIISHGGDGAVQLGAAVLDFDTLVRNATQIKGWAEAFTSNGDLLLYGCDVAATTEGRALVDALGRLTGADVAASTDLTGDARLGGDWALEYATGEIEARAVVDGAGSGAWSGVLAITQNGSATSAKTDSATSLTWSHTVASGSDRALFVTLAIDGLGANVTGVTYGGVAMTQVGRTTGNHAVEIWSLVNPTVGTANVVVNFGGSTPAAGGAVAYNGVNQSTPTGTYAGANGTGTTSSVTVTSAAGELVIDAENWRGSAAGYAVGANQSLLWSQTNTTNTGKSTTEAGAASVTMSSTVSSSAQWEIGAVSIKPVANSAPVITSNGGGASASVNVAENSTAVTTVTATDANGDTLSYAISGGADAAKFAINSSTGALSFVSAPNYEAPTDTGANNVYDVTVQVSDGNGGTDTQALAVTVTNANEAVEAIADAYTAKHDAALSVDWWNSAWTRRSQLTFDNSAQAENLSNFPVLVRLDASRIDYAQTQSAGQDLRFFDADGTALAYEIEKWDESGSSYVWVKVPQVDASSSSDYIWMYYGNASAAAGQNAAAVWTNGYAMVQHLEESSGTLTDSTANANNGTASGVTLNAAGKIAGGDSFDGSSSAVTVTDSASLDITSGLTLSGWVYADSVSGWPTIVFKGTSTSEFNYYLALHDGEVVLGSYNGGLFESESTGADLQANRWYHVAATYNDAADAIKFYVNGTQVGADVLAATPLLTNGLSATIGRGAWGDWWSGSLDEVRIESTTRSAAWMAAQYASMTDHFIGYSAAQSAPAVAGVLSNDSDATNDPLTAVLVSGPSHGSLTLRPNE